MPARNAWVRKSGVVSISTFCPPRDSRTEVRIRLSRGSLEVHTAQRQPIVGTPIEVPEPRTVSCNVFPFDEIADMIRVFESRRDCRRLAPASSLWPLAWPAQPAPG